MRLFVLLLLICQLSAAAPGDKLPADCWAAMHVDLAALRKTKCYERFVLPLADDFVSGTGISDFVENFDLSGGDIDSFTAGMVGVDFSEVVPIFVVIRGRFDTAKLVRSAVASGEYRTEQKDGVTLFKPTESDLHVALPDPNILLVAMSESALNKLLVAARAKKDRGPLATLLARRPAAQMRIALIPDDAVRRMIREEPESAVFAGLESGLATYVATDKKLEGLFTLTGRSEAEAQQVGQAVKALLAGVPLGDPFHKAELSRTGTSVSIRVSMTLEEIARQNGLGRPDAKSVLESDGAPELKGKGRLYRVLIKGSQRQVNRFFVSPDERFVLANAALSGCFTLDSKFSIAGRNRNLSGTDLAFCPDGKTLFWFNRFAGDAKRKAGRPDERGYYAFRYSIPDLQYLGASPKLEEGVSTSGAWAICLLPDKKSYAIVGWDAIQLLHLDPLRWRARGKAGIRRPVAGAVDPKTGLLVMVGDVDLCEIFDPRTMKTVATAQLPYKVTYGVVAGGGMAWVGNDAGMVLPIDLARRKLGKPLRLVEKGEARLALSASGKTLAVAVTTWVDSRHRPTLLKIYSVAAGGRLTETASARFVASRTLWSPVLLEKKKVLLMAGERPLAWRYGEGAK